MIPILSSSYPYTGNGLGGLPDAIECVVTHEINGIYELMMRYPITGEHYSEILNNYFVMAKPDNLSNAQPFRIYRITKPLNGVVTIYARHISYDMAGIIVEPFSASTLTAAFTTIPTKCTPSSPITLATTRTVNTGIELKEPRPLWRLLGGQEGSLLDIYGGEWDFDRLTATLKTELGTNRGVEIRYGKNLTELEQDATLESTYSAVYPYWYDEESNTLVTISEKYVSIAGAVVSNRVLILDCSGDFESAPSQQDLRDRANAYITANSVGNMKTSWKVSFISLAAAKEYETQALLEQVLLGDTLNVYYEALGVNATSRVIKTDYDVLKDQYKELTIGRVRQNLASIIVGNNAEVNEKIDRTKSALEKAVDDATYAITHGAGQFRVIYNGNNVQEIVSLDNANISQAQSVWRWNNGGFGHSSTGYNGTFTLALTANGAINADMITVGSLNAQRITTGILTDALGNNSWDLDTGAFTLTNGSVNISTNIETADIIQFNGDTRNNQGYGTVCTTQMQPIGYSVVSHFYTASSHTRYISRLYGNTGGLYLETNIYSNQQPTEILTTSYAVHGGSGFSVYQGTGIGVTPSLASIFDAANGITFYNSSGTQTAKYPADISTFFTANTFGVKDMTGNTGELISSSGTTKSYTLATGTYIVTTSRSNNSSTAQDGVWLVSCYASGTSHLSALLSPSGSTSVTILGDNLTVTTGSNNVRVSVTKMS